MNKPVHAKPSLYSYYFSLIKEIGYKYGYNIILHGSMNRDLDLIAIPWQQQIGDKIKMLVEIADVIGGSLVTEYNGNHEKQREMFHGRECWAININRRITHRYEGASVLFEKNEDPQYYIDISIIPTLEKTT